MNEAASRNPTSDDAVLVGRMRAGDDGALGAVYDRHADVVFGIARRVSGDPHLAREVTQDVFAHLWEHPERVDLERGSLRTYLAVVAHRRAVDGVRRRSRRDRAETKLAEQPSDASASPEVDVVDTAARRWRQQRLLAAVAQLPPDQRMALDLAYFQGHTYRQVAQALGIPEGTAKSRLRLALASLRSRLTQDLNHST